MKAGDKVRVIAIPYELTLETAAMSGKICEVKEVNDYDEIASVFTPDKKDFWWFNQSDLELIKEPRTIHQVAVGDIIIVENGEQKILSVSGLACLLSYSSNHDAACSWYTFNELERYGYKIKEENTEEVDEITMEELCKELGREVKIKK